MRDLAGSGLVGLVFGFSLSRMGFSSWDEVHKMFTFADLRLTLTFALAMVILTLAWMIIKALSKEKPDWPRRTMHPGTVIGGLVFGAGWAISGACPSIALVQLGEGQLAAGWTVIGILGGNYLYAKTHERWFSWTVGSCVDE